MTRLTWLKPFVVGSVGAILGTLLVLAGWHLYIDHQNLHVLVSLVQQQAAKAAAQPSTQGSK